MISRSHAIHPGKFPLLLEETTTLAEFLSPDFASEMV